MSYQLGGSSSSSSPRDRAPPPRLVVKRKYGANGPFSAASSYTTGGPAKEPGAGSSTSSKPRKTTTSTPLYNMRHAPTDFIRAQAISGKMMSTEPTQNFFYFPEKDENATANNNGGEDGATGERKGETAAQAAPAASLRKLEEDIAAKEASLTEEIGQLEIDSAVDSVRGSSGAGAATNTTTGGAGAPATTTTRNSKLADTETIYNPGGATTVVGTSASASVRASQMETTPQVATRDAAASSAGVPPPPSSANDDNLASLPQPSKLSAVSGSKRSVVTASSAPPDIEEYMNVNQIPNARSTISVSGGNNARTTSSSAMSGPQSGNPINPGSQQQLLQSNTTSAQNSQSNAGLAVLFRNHFSKRVRQEFIANWSQVFPRKQSFDRIDYESFVSGCKRLQYPTSIIRKTFLALVSMSTSKNYSSAQQYPPDEEKFLLIQDIAPKLHSMHKEFASKLQKRYGTLDKCYRDTLSFLGTTNHNTFQTAEFDHFLKWCNSVNYPRSPEDRKALYSYIGLEKDCCYLDHCFRSVKLVTRGETVEEDEFVVKILPEFSLDQIGATREQRLGINEKINQLKQTNKRAVVLKPGMKVGRNSTSKVEPASSRHSSPRNLATRGGAASIGSSRASSPRVLGGGGTSMSQQQLQSGTANRVAPTWAPRNQMSTRNAQQRGGGHQFQDFNPTPRSNETGSTPRVLSGFPKLRLHERPQKDSFVAASDELYSARRSARGPKEEPYIARSGMLKPSGASQMSDQTVETGRTRRVFTTKSFLETVVAEERWLSAHAAKTTATAGTILAATATAAAAADPASKPATPTGTIASATTRSRSASPAKPSSAAQVSGPGEEAESWLNAGKARLRSILDSRLGRLRQNRLEDEAGWNNVECSSKLSVLKLVGRFNDVFLERPIESKALQKMQEATRSSSSNTVSHNLNTTKTWQKKQKVLDKELLEREDSMATSFDIAMQAASPDGHKIRDTNAKVAKLETKAAKEGFYTAVAMELLRVHNHKLELALTQRRSDLKRITSELESRLKLGAKNGLGSSKLRYSGIISEFYGTLRVCFHVTENFDEKLLGPWVVEWISGILQSGSDTKATATTAASPSGTTGTAAAKKQPKILRTEIKIDADNPLLSSRRLTEVNFFFLFPTEQEAEVACRFKAEKLIFAEAIAARMGVKRIRNLRFLTDKHPWWSSDIAKTFRAGWLEAFCPLRKKPFLYHVKLGLSTWIKQEDGDEKLPGGVKIMTKFREKEKPPTLAAMVKGEKSNLDIFPVSHLRRNWETKRGTVVLGEKNAADPDQTAILDFLKIVKVVRRLRKLIWKKRALEDGKTDGLHMHVQREVENFVAAWNICKATGLLKKNKRDDDDEPSDSAAVAPSASSNTKNNSRKTATRSPNAQWPPAIRASRLIDLSLDETQVAEEMDAMLAGVDETELLVGELQPALQQAEQQDGAGGPGQQDAYNDDQPDASGSGAGGVEDLYPQEGEEIPVPEPTDRRYDPGDGNVYTFEEVQEFYKDYASPEEILAHWYKEMTEVGE
ncbi:unnamed protein product [Amoebophrya sp. A120]|nr:unnamed protein product [Amoebophrya sp. A120]|eukprot:GSA120T00008760001.1